MSLFPALLSASSRRRSDGSTAVVFDPANLSFVPNLNLGGAAPPDYSRPDVFGVSNASSELAVFFTFIKCTHTKTINAGQILSGEVSGVAVLPFLNSFLTSSWNTMISVGDGIPASTSNKRFSPAVLTDLVGGISDTRISGSVVINEVCGWSIDPTLVGGLSGPVPSSTSFYAGFTADAVEAVSFKFAPGITIAYDYITEPYS